MASYSVVGQRQPWKNAQSRALGIERYAADLKLAGMLHAKLLRSPVPHAAIRAIDTSRAKRLPGVRAVLCAGDIPRVLFGHYGNIIQDQPLLAYDRVRFIGEPVAAVAAIDADIAEEACDLIDVEYDELPALFDPIAAMQPGALLIHEHAEQYAIFRPLIRQGNVCSTTIITHGDVEQGFAAAEHLFEQTYETQMAHQTYVEPRAQLAAVEPDGRVTVWTSTQAAFVVRAELAHVLQLPVSRIRVIATSVGGSFGAKGKMDWEPYCVLLSQAAGAPVRFVMTREEELSTATPRHPCTITIKSGVKRDGTIIARAVKLVYDTGAYASFGPVVASEGAQQARGPYRIPNLHLESHAVYTNKVSAACMRCHGTPQPTFAFESHMDSIAAELGIDPLEFRLRHAVQDGDLHTTGLRYKDIGLIDTLHQLEAHHDPGRLSLPPGRGRGVASGQWMSGGRASSAFVKLIEDGTVQVQTGAVDVTGANIVIAQVAAEELGLPVESVNTTAVDTELSPFDAGSSGSRIAYCMGHAVREAAQDARRQVLAVAAKRFGVAPQELVLRDGAVRVAADPTRRLPLDELARYSMVVGGGPIIGRGSFVGPPSEFDANLVQGLCYSSAQDFAYVSQLAEVTVDRETGQVRVEKIVSTHDIGFAINPMSVEGQIEGGVAQGLGYALMEEVRLQEGRVVYPSLLEYRPPTAMDVPKIVPVLVESHPSKGPYGAKGIGEPPIIPTSAAIANAIRHATGVRVTALPMTPERVWRALQAASPAAWRAG
ncbi:MAG: xanthine dehydrogenase family protein molybdopterin-binding subunit [Candidatus Tectomicrobia bacterium]|nr:xanthine dehydrogenase family protein molybdopterin-binding subunit [Candidatus Tectomicrobia bacterium]